MNTSNFIKRLRSMCDELEKINTGEQTAWSSAIGAVASKYGIPDLEDLVQG